MMERLTDEQLTAELDGRIALRDSYIKHGYHGTAAAYDATIMALTELKEWRMAAPQLPQPAAPFGFTDGDAHGMVYEPRHADRLANPMPVYRLHPQPAVVPHPVSAVKGELAFIDHFERIIGDRDGDIDIGQLGRGNYDALMLAALDAFRATMLQAGNSQVIPDAWIPVSERMPPNKPGSYEYIVFESLNNRAHHDYWNVPDGSCDDFPPFWNHYGKYVTHWMLLPAAPQQESE